MWKHIKKWCKFFLLIHIFFQRITKLILWQDLFIYTHYFLEYTMGQNFKYSGIKQNYSGMSNLAFITINDFGWLSPAKNLNYKRFYFFYLDSQSIRYHVWEFCSSWTFWIFCPTVQVSSWGWFLQVVFYDGAKQNKFSI